MKKIFGLILAAIGINSLLDKDADASIPPIEREKITDFDIGGVLNNVTADIDGAIQYALGDRSLPRGIRNNNAGNLVKTNINWQGKIPNAQNSDGRFEQFSDPVYGLRALYKDIINDYNEGKKSISALISEYAPKSENDTQAYINAVSKETGINPNSAFNLTGDNLIKIAKAIVLVENGRGKINPYWYSDEQYKEAYRKAVA